MSMKQLPLIKTLLLMDPGYISELLFYNEELTNSEIEILVTGLKLLYNKWGLSC
jgi:hypothetical protein